MCYSTIFPSYRKSGNTWTSFPRTAARRRAVVGIYLSSSSSMTCTGRLRWRMLSDLCSLQQHIPNCLSSLVGEVICQDVWVHKVFVFSCISWTILMARFGRANNLMVDHSSSKLVISLNVVARNVSTKYFVFKEKQAGLNWKNVAVILRFIFILVSMFIYWTVCMFVTAVFT